MGTFGVLSIVVLWLTRLANMASEKKLTPEAPSISGSRSENAVDVLVIGGGVAGLTAVKKLTENGIDNIVLLEAQEKLGGRIKSFKREGVLLEEGAQWIHGDGRNPLYKLAKSLSLALPAFSDENYDYVLKRLDGTTHPDDVEIADRIETFYLDSLVKGELQGLYGYGDYFKERMETDNLTSSLNPTMKKAWLHSLEQVVNSNEGTSDWNDISAIDADNYLDYGEDHQWVNGFSDLVSHLADSIALTKAKVQLNTPVKKILWDKEQLAGQVEVIGEDGSKFLAKKVLVTISVGCLKSRYQQLFDPPLPTELSTALKYIDLGGANKIWVHWDAPWWGNGHLDLHILRTSFDTSEEPKWTEGVVNFFSLEHSPSTLVAFITGNYSFQMEELTENEIKEDLMFLFRNIMKEHSIPEPLFVGRTRWNKNIWTLGSYGSFISVEGALKGLHSRKIYRKPLINSRHMPVVFWAGEHTHTQRFGTADGAYSSGLEAARLITKVSKK